MAPPRIAVPLAVLGLASTLFGAPATASASGQYVDVSIGETPNAVAVADNGVIAASLFDAQAVALVDASGAVRRASLGCSPNDVAIAPSGQTAWAVCQSDPHVHVVDVASGEVSVADMGATGLDDIVYLPAVDQLLIA